MSQCFPKPKMTSSNILCLPPKDIQFLSVRRKELKTFTSKKLE